MGSPEPKSKPRRGASAGRPEQVAGDQESIIGQSHTWICSLSVTALPQSTAPRTNSPLMKIAKSGLSPFSSAIRSKRLVTPSLR